MTVVEKLAAAIVMLRATALITLATALVTFATAPMELAMLPIEISVELTTRFANVTVEFGIVELWKARIRLHSRAHVGHAGVDGRALVGHGGVYGRTQGAEQLVEQLGDKHVPQSHLRESS
jgi:hypothetical protein